MISRDRAPHGPSLTYSTPIHGDKAHGWTLPEVARNMTFSFHVDKGFVQRKPRRPDTPTIFTDSCETVSTERGRETRGSEAGN